MFIGHFATVHPLRRWFPNTPVYVHTIGVGFLDIVFAVICALWHVEGVTVDPSEGKLGVQLHCDYSHSLLGAVFFSTLYGLLAQVIVGGNNRQHFVAGFVASFSHWLQDWLVHNHDLLLDPWSRIIIGGTLLWSKYPKFATIAELLMAVVLGWFYVPEKERKDTYALVINVLLLVVFHYGNEVAFPQLATASLMQPTVDLQDYGLAASMLFVFVTPAIILGWVSERRRRQSMSDKKKD
ncbi:hypothetical protein K492DRAFT_171365 [Lichtheimia hyalospora FSU 10163]|nr:hypothetical protein K492DRAFT_171365 [Lichtheimia hyalospora FSU 10163]